MTAEVKLERCLSVLRWPLQAFSCFSPGPPSTGPPCGIRMVPVSQVLGKGSLGAEEEIDEVCVSACVPVGVALYLCVPLPTMVFKLLAAESVSVYGV